jgi:tetratricopeptide (TPR) repeat protein
MLSALLGDGKDLLPLKRLIIERTEGNPFFVEEIVQALFEDGVLQRNGSVKLAKSMNAVKVPTTVQAVLAARIDRLPAEAKELLQTLAVIGREFSLSLIREVVSKSNDELKRLLNDLQMGEFIYEQPAVGDTEYIFKHALTQEVAYNSLLIERRKQIHERIGAALEGLYTSSLDDHLDELAHHYNRGANPDKAVEYLTRAGQQALNRSAFTEAQSQLQQGVEWIKKLPPSPEHDARELELVGTLVQVLMVTRGFNAPETRATAERARDLAEKGGNLAQLVVQVYGIWANVIGSGDYPTAGLLADQILDLAQRAGNPASLGFACRAQADVCFSRGDFVGAEEHCARGRSFLDEEGFRQVPGAVMGIFVISSLCAWALGRSNLARERIAQAMTFARDSNNPADLVFGRLFESLLSYWLREPQGAEVAGTQGLATTEEHGFPLYRNAMLPLLGWGRAQLGNLSEGMALIHQGLTGMAEAGFKYGITEFLTMLAEGEALDGKIDDALITLEEALQANAEELVFRPNPLTFRGELRLKIGQSELAERDFRDAIALSQKMKAKAWELRATLSLARLLASQGSRDEARTTLADIYNWFTEGFDTADLKEAKALLAELSE